MLLPKPFWPLTDPFPFSSGLTNFMFWAIPFVAVWSMESLLWAIGALCRFGAVHLIGVVFARFELPSGNPCGELCNDWRTERDSCRETICCSRRHNGIEWARHIARGLFLDVHLLSSWEIFQWGCILPFNSSHFSRKQNVEFGAVIRCRLAEFGRPL